MKEGAVHRALQLHLKNVEAALNPIDGVDQSSLVHVDIVDLGLRLALRRRRYEVGYLLWPERV